MNAKVHAYIERLPSPQREICEKLRVIILNTFPDIEETLKNGVPWYEDKYYLVGLKDHVNIGFSIKGLSSEEMRVFEGKGKVARHIKVYTPDDIDEDAIVRYLNMVKEKM